MENINCGYLVFVNNCSNCSLYDSCPNIELREKAKEKYLDNQIWCNKHPDLKPNKI